MNFLVGSPEMSLQVPYNRGEGRRAVRQIRLELEQATRPRFGKETMKYRQANIEDIELLVSLVNKAYRGNESKVGWTTEADFLDGQRTDKTEMIDLLSKKDSCMLVYPSEEGELNACVYLELQASPQANSSATSSANKADKSSHNPSAKPSVYLGMLTVKPHLQGKGWGKQVLKDAETWIKENWNATKIQMTVITIRTELLEFYERRGYTRTATVAPFPYGDETKGIPLRDDLKFVYLEKML